MTLGTFTPRTRVAGDKIDLRNQQFYNRPFLVTAVEYNDAFHSKFANNGAGAPVEAVWVDVLDVLTGSVLINVLFTNGAIVDNLKENVSTGVILPVKISKRTGGQFGGYAALDPLTDAEAAQAQQAYQSGAWQRVAEERARREAAAKPMGNLQQEQSPFGNQGQQAAPQQGGMFGQQNQAPAFGNPQQNAFQGQAPASSFEQPGGQPQWNQQQAPAQNQGQFGGPVQGFQGQPNQQGQFGAPQQAMPVQDPNPMAQQYPQAAPQQGFQGQAPQQNQFQQAAPQQDPNQFAGQAPQQNAFQGQAPAQQPMAGPQQDAAAQQALANLNSGQFS